MTNEIDSYYLIVADETGRSDVALYYAMKSAKQHNAGIAILHVLQHETSIFMPWGSVTETIENAAESTARSLIESIERRIKERHIPYLTYSEEGNPIDVVKDLLKKEKRLSKIILAANTDAGSPGPLVSYFATTGLKELTIPLTIVPTHIDFDLE